MNIIRRRFRTRYNTSLMGMTPEVVISTLPLSEGDILCHTRNFLPYQAYLGSVITSSQIEAYQKFVISHQ